MTVPTGAITNAAVSLTKAVKNPTQSNIIALSTAAALTTGDPNATAAVTNAASLVGGVSNLLGQGNGASVTNTVNSAVRLAQGFLDPNTAAVVGQVSGAINQLFGANGILSPFKSGTASGNKPVALHSDTMPTQEMGSAYSEGNDVVFSFVRMDGTFGVDDGSLDDTADALTGAGALSNASGPLSDLISKSVGGQLGSLSAAATGVVTGAGLGSLKGAALGAANSFATQFTPQ